MTDGLEEIGLPPLGHNKPPEDHDKLFALQEQLTETVNKWLAERPAINDPEMAKACQLLIDQQVTLRDKLEAAEKAEREPVQLLLDGIKIKFKVPTQMLEVGIGLMRTLMKGWLQKQRDREQAEQRQREQEANDAIAAATKATHEATQPGATVEQRIAAEEANKRAARLTDEALSGPARPQVKGDFAKKAMGLHSNWKARIIDPRACLKHYAKHETVRRAALKAAQSLANAEARAAKGQGEPPPGCEWFNDERAQ